MDNWFDSYILDHGGKVSWALFCWDVCQRFGNTMPINIVREFNRLDQLKDVETYQRRFEELCCLMITINPALHEPYLVTCFIGGLKPDIMALVQFANPRTLMDAYTCAKLHEQSFNSLYKQITTYFGPRTSYQTARLALPTPTKKPTYNNHH